MTAADKAVMENEQEEWQLTEQQKREQPKVLANRLRLACRHVCQALGEEDIAPMDLRDLWNKGVG